MKVVINNDYGGFGLSDLAMQLYLTRKELPYHMVKKSFYTSFHKPEDEEAVYYECDFDRNDPVLVAVVEELGVEANGKYASLKVVDVPDDVEWDIGEYDGREWVAEKHRTWE